MLESWRVPTVARRSEPRRAAWMWPFLLDKVTESTCLHTDQVCPWIRQPIWHTGAKCLSLWTKGPFPDVAGLCLARWKASSDCSGRKKTWGLALQQDQTEFVKVRCDLQVCLECEPNKNELRARQAKFERGEVRQGVCAGQIRRVSVSVFSMMRRYVWWLRTMWRKPSILRLWPTRAHVEMLDLAESTRAIWGQVVIGGEVPLDEWKEEHSLQIARACSIAWSRRQAYPRIEGR